MKTMIWLGARQASRRDSPSQDWCIGKIQPSRPIGNMRGPVIWACFHARKQTRIWEGWVWLSFLRSEVRCALSLCFRLTIFRACYLVSMTWCKMMCLYIMCGCRSACQDKRGRERRGSGGCGAILFLRCNLQLSVCYSLSTRVKTMAVVYVETCI